MLNRIDRTYFPPSLTEQYAAKIAIDETADLSQPIPSNQGTRREKPRAAKKHFLDFRNHGGPHHCGRRFPGDPTMPDKRLDLLGKAYAMEVAQKNVPVIDVNDAMDVAGIIQ